MYLNSLLPFGKDGCLLCLGVWYCYVALIATLEVNVDWTEGTHADTHAQTYIQAHIQIYMHAHTYIDTHTCIHTYPSQYVCALPG